MPAGAAALVCALRHGIDPEDALAPVALRRRSAVLIHRKAAFWFPPGPPPPGEEEMAAPIERYLV